MKKTILFAFGMMLSASAVFAQSETKMRRDSVLTNVMKLTPEKKSEFEALINEYGKTTKQINNDASLSDDEKKEKRNAFKKEHRAKQKALLTADQNKAWEDFTRSENERKKQK